ncbi:hypothetical protein DFS34DRAFT_382825 [Phlyctochytrium arcticum]|nr:hypothetical protein DFS34DRAFT_382825 [Phlyctochytrium arcticum]
MRRIRSAEYQNEAFYLPYQQQQSSGSGSALLASSHLTGGPSAGQLPSASLLANNNDDDDADEDVEEYSPSPSTEFLVLPDDHINIQDGTSSIRSVHSQSNTYIRRSILPRSSPFGKPQQKNRLLSKLPPECWSRIFSALEPSSTLPFALTCKHFLKIAGDPHTRADYMVERYGAALSLYYAFRFHRPVLSVNVAKLMRKRGAKFPRFLVQWVDKEYHRTDRGRKAVPISLYVYFIQEGYIKFGSEADFKEDDVARFERLLHGGGPPTAGPNSTLSINPDVKAIEGIRTLLDKYGFVPVRGLGSPVDETIFMVSKLSLPLIPKFIANGLDMASINDQVLERVLWRADLTTDHLQSYLDHGFTLTNGVVKKGLQIARMNTLDILKSKVSEGQLVKCAEMAIVDMFGPSTTSGRGWNWVSESVDFILTQFTIPESTLKKAIYANPTTPSLPNGARPDFPATRSYLKSNPCPVWRWVLKRYGPTHEVTLACFDDALSRAAADRDLHALHDDFIAAGVGFYPRHVKILACRLLHRDMTANALHLLKTLRTQLVESRESGSMTDSDRLTWLTTFKEEVTENTEWMHRMRTTQLEGGARGGAYRITRPPDDALRFLEDARRIEFELSVPIRGLVVKKVVEHVDSWGFPLGFPSSSSSSPLSSRRSSFSAKTVTQRSSRRNTLPMSIEAHPFDETTLVAAGNTNKSASMRTWVKRMGTWWRETCERGVWGTSVDHIV